MTFVFLWNPVYNKCYWNTCKSVTKSQSCAFVYGCFWTTMTKQSQGRLPGKETQNIHYVVLWRQSWPIPSAQHLYLRRVWISANILHSGKLLPQTPLEAALPLSTPIVMVYSMMSLQLLMCSYAVFWEGDWIKRVGWSLMDKPTDSA